MPLVLLVPSAGLALVMILSHAAQLAALSGGFAAVLGGLWLVSWANRRMNLARGAIPPFATAFGGLLLGGTLYSDVPKTSAVVLAVAPLLSMVDRMGPVARLSPRKAAVVRIIAVVMATIAAIACAFALRPPDNPYGS
jgi:hypothetical protein